MKCTCRYCGRTIFGPNPLACYVDDETNSRHCKLPSGGSTLHHPTRSDLGLSDAWPWETKVPADVK